MIANVSYSYELSSKDGKIQSLTIRNLTLKDGGIYTCQIGDRHTEATLTVNESRPCNFVFSSIDKS